MPFIDAKFVMAGVAIAENTQSKNASTYWKPSGLGGIDGAVFDKQATMEKKRQASYTPSRTDPFHSPAHSR